MATIYLSSTYSDLKGFRDAVYKVLRQLRHDVIAMEDYVATDERPLDKCLADVAGCDAYVGIIAWRYGYIPPINNPEGKSITELEYRRAIEGRKPCFLFLADDNAPWPRSQIETGDGAKSIDAFRATLKRNHVVSFFHSEEDLARSVSVAVANQPSLNVLSPAQVIVKSSAPPLPLNYISRSVELDILRNAILNGTNQRDIALTALEGMGGIGKSVLAAALCHDKTIQAAFPDGVHWVVVGREPGNLVRQMSEIGKAFGDSSDHYDTPESSAARLRSLLQNKSVLLVIDDVWDVRHVEAFRVDAQNCRTLFTTRDSNIALALGAQEVKLGIFAPPQALAFLRQSVGRNDPQLMNIARRLGCLPVALRLAAARLREGMTGAEWLDTFQHLWQLRLNSRSTDRTDNLQVCFDLSTDGLSETQRFLYYALGVFPEDEKISPNVISRLWKQMQPALSQFECDELMTDLRRLALIEQDSSARVSLHDLLYDYTHDKLGEHLTEVHLALLNSYNLDVRPWFDIEDDGYLYNHLAYHLCGSHRQKELRELLMNFQWLAAKLPVTGVNSLLIDYSFLPQDPTLRLLESGIRLSARVLGHDTSQLATQLYGRLMGSTLREIQHFTRGIQSVNGHWLRLLTPTLEPAGGQLVSIMSGHSYSIGTLAVTPDDRQIISGDGWGGCLKVWDLASGSEMRVLSDQAGWITALAVTPDGRQVISGARSGSFKVWDLDTGIELSTVAAHGAPIWALAVTPDGHQIISGSGDYTIKVWDLMTGCALRVLVGHTSAVTALAVTGDGLQAVSGSADATLMVWNLRSGEAVCSLTGHYGAISSVALISDRKALSGSSDRSLRIWDLEQKKEIASLSGHRAGVNAIAVTRDQQTAISGADDGSIWIWDLAHRNHTSSLKGHLAAVNAIGVSSKGDTVISGSADALVKVWDLTCNEEPQSGEVSIGDVRALLVKSGIPQALLMIDDFIYSVWDLQSGKKVCNIKSAARWGDAIATLPQAQKLLLSVYGGVIVWDLVQGEARRLLNIHDGKVSSVTGTPDGRLVITFFEDGMLKVTDVNSGEEVLSQAGYHRTLIDDLDLDPRLKHCEPVTCMVVAPDGKHVISASERGELLVWDLATGRNLFILSRPGSYFSKNPEIDGEWYNVEGVAVTPDGRRVIARRADGAMRVWNLLNGKELQPEVPFKVVSADGTRALLFSDEDTATVSDLDNDRRLHSLPINHYRIPQRACVTISNDGRLSAAPDYYRGNDPFEIQICDLNNGMPLRNLAYRSSQVYQRSEPLINYSPDLTRITLAIGDELIVWDTQSGAPLGRFVSDSPLVSCDITPDGTTIVARARSGVTHFLRVDADRADSR